MFTHPRGFDPNAFPEPFGSAYRTHLQHLKLKGLQPKTIDVYARTIRRMGEYFGYLFNHKALAKVFRAKLLAALVEEGLLLPADLPRKWVVDCKAVGSGEKALVPQAFYGWQRFNLRQAKICIGNTPRQPQEIRTDNSINRKTPDGIPTGNASVCDELTMHQVVQPVQ